MNVRTCRFYLKHGILKVRTFQQCGDAVLPHTWDHELKYYGSTEPNSSSNLGPTTPTFQQLKCTFRNFHPSQNLPNRILLSRGSLYISLRSSNSFRLIRRGVALWSWFAVLVSDWDLCPLPLKSSPFLAITIFLFSNSITEDIGLFHHARNGTECLEWNMEISGACRKTNVFLLQMNMQEGHEGTIWYDSKRNQQLRSYQTCEVNCVWDCAIPIDFFHIRKNLTFTIYRTNLPTMGASSWYQFWTNNSLSLLFHPLSFGNLIFCGFSCTLRHTAFVRWETTNN